MSARMTASNPVRFESPAPAAVFSRRLVLRFAFLGPAGGIIPIPAKRKLPESLPFSKEFLKVYAR